MAPSPIGPITWYLSSRISPLRSSASITPSPPELLRSDRSALRQGGEFGPDHIRIDSAGAHVMAESAVHGSHEVVAADKMSVPADPLRDELRMLDVVRLALDDTGNQDLALGDL